jgi:hypothetical protein
MNPPPMQLRKALKFWEWRKWRRKLVTLIRYYPQDLLLSFEGGSYIVISALEIVGDRVVAPDHITIFDDVQMAKKFGCLNTA